MTIYLLFSALEIIYLPDELIYSKIQKISTPRILEYKSLQQKKDSQDHRKPTLQLKFFVKLSPKYIYLLRNKGNLNCGQMKKNSIIERFMRGLLMFPLALLLLNMGCYPDQPEYVEEYDAVYTNYSPDFNFSVTYTYSLPEQVLLVDDKRGPDDPPEFVDQVYGDAILNSIRKNLNANNWTEVDENADPDLVILPSAFDKTFLYFYDPGYWCWYYCYPGWGYPGYSPGYVSGYRTGTVLLQMTDPNGVQANEVPVVWTGSFNGLLQGSEANIVGRINRNLDQAFSHPPFDNN